MFLSMSKKLRLAEFKKYWQKHCCFKAQRCRVKAVCRLTNYRTCSHDRHARGLISATSGHQTRLGSSMVSEEGSVNELAAAAAAAAAVAAAVAVAAPAAAAARTAAVARVVAAANVNGLFTP